MAVSGITQVLNNYFLNPIGLLGLTALVPLIIFYMIKKKPEEELMPSMMFFMEEKDSGKVKNAFRKFLRNLFLLLHILIIIGLAAALAHPFIESQSQSGNKVLILDRSASMSGDLTDAKDFLRSNLGSQNTLILADDSDEIAVERGSRSRIKAEIGDVKVKHIESDPVSALKTARNYNGDVIIGSDLDQTVSSGDPESIIEEMRDKGRTVRIMETEDKNAWGIINIDPGRNSSEVDVKNFKAYKVSPEITVNGKTEQLEISRGSVASIDIEMEEGKNTIHLEEDGFEPDNSAFISAPEEEEYDIAYIADEENPYLEKAFELINFTRFNYFKPPVRSEIDADLYIVGETDKILSETVREIESEVSNGAGLAVFSHRDVFRTGFESLPANKTGSMEEMTVSIRKPIISVLETEILNVSKTRGEEYTSTNNGLIAAEHGDGRVLFYNIQDRDFRRKFLYPVFWKRITREMMDRPPIEELNIKTGEEIEAEEILTPKGVKESGIIRADHTGFYNASGNLYAANLLSEDESFSEDVGEEIEYSPNIEKETKDVQNLLSLLLVLVLIGEAAYLRRIGDLS